MSCLVSDVRKVHDISRALDLNYTVFALFVFGEKLLLNHKMNKPLPWYVVSSYTVPRLPNCPQGLSFALDFVSGKFSLFGQFLSLGPV